MDDPVFFFVGNCQTQYLASMVGSVTDAPRYFLGRKLAVNVSVEGPQATFLAEPQFLDLASRTKAAGRTAVLVAQETSLGAYSGIAKTQRHRFTNHAMLPHVHFKSLWPERSLRKPVDELADNAIKRNRAMEGVELDRKFARCGIDPPAFSPGYWREAEEHLRFYSPAHATGPVFAEVLHAMAPTLSGELPFYDELVAALSRSPGIFQNSFHPIHPRVADLLGVAWAKTEFYQAWMGLRAGADDASTLRPAARRAQAVLDRPELMSVASDPIASHMRASTGLAWLKLGRRRIGLDLLARAVIELKGFAPLLQKTTRIALRTGRQDVIETLLVGVSPYVDFSKNLHSQTYDRTFLNAAQTPFGRQAMLDTLEKISPDAWLHGYLTRTLAQAG